MGRRIAVEPFRMPEPDRSAFVAVYGERLVSACEGDVTREHDLIVNGDPAIAAFARSIGLVTGILHGSDLVRR